MPIEFRFRWALMALTFVLIRTVRYLHVVPVSRRLTHP
jgi:hypothetical protein